MRFVMIGSVIALMSSSAFAQQPSGQNPAQAMKTFVSSADIAAVVAKAKSARKEGQAMVTSPLLEVGAYKISIEYRSAATISGIHEREDEFFYVLDGGATLTTGGTLVNGKRSSPEHMSGTAIEGGTQRHITKGDIAIVPAGTPHWFGAVDGVAVFMMMRMPRPASSTP